MPPPCGKNGSVKGMKTETKLAVGYVLGSAFAGATLLAGIHVSADWGLTTLVWLAGGTLGWIIDVVASPQTDEKRDFLKYAKTGSALATGYIASKLEILFTRALDAHVPIDQIFSGVLVFAVALGIGMMFTFVGRRYA